MKKLASKLAILTVLLAIFLAEVFFIWKQEAFRSQKVAATQKVAKAKTAQEEIAIRGVEIKRPVSLLFVGDLMFDRYIRQVAEKRGNNFSFEKMGDLLDQADLVVANLEGPVTDNQSRSVNTEIGAKGHLVFTFDQSLAKTLYDENIKLVNIGNNHIGNFGTEGIKQTKEKLTEAQVGFFGHDQMEYRTKIENIGGTKIGFANYNQFIEASPDKTLEGIKNLKNQADFVVVYTHWGVEYKTGEPEENIKKIAHLFVDSGADLIIGTHPHVVESEEEYQGKRIYYSLGNFIFDQYFSSETKRGLAVRVKIDPESRQIEFENINLIIDNNGQTRPDKV